MHTNNKGLDNLKIYKLAEELEVFIFEITKNFPEDEKYRSVNQLRRSSASVSDNIAEGYGRYSFQDKINKFYIARGEAEETRKGIGKTQKKNFISVKIADLVDKKYVQLIKQVNAYINFLRRQSKNTQSLSTQVPNPQYPIPKYPSARGFTLIELLVVIGITGLIAGLVVANMRVGGQVKDLNSDAEKLAGIIKQAQMMALSGKQIGSSRPAGGYGVYITADSYKLFADDQNVDNHQYDADGVNDTVIQNFNFTELVAADFIEHNYIIFLPPKGMVYVGTTNPGTELIGTSLITLKHAINRYAYVEVNAQGQVDVRK